MPSIVWRCNGVEGAFVPTCTRRWRVAGESCSPAQHERADSKKRGMMKKSRSSINNNNEECFIQFVVRYCDDKKWREVVPCLAKDAVATVASSPE